MMRILRVATLALAMMAPLVASAQTQPPAATRANTLRVVVHANLQILDPVWTTSFISGRHAYLIYDTLYAMNSASSPNRKWRRGTRFLKVASSIASGCATGCVSMMAILSDHRMLSYHCGVG